jgi:ribosomal 30S subunit maturation factor RimM
MQISDLIPIGKLGIPSSKKDNLLVFRSKQKISLENIKDIFLVFPDHRVRYVTIDKVTGSKKNQFSILETEVIAEMKNMRNVTVMLDPENWNKSVTDHPGDLLHFEVEYNGKIIGKVINLIRNPGQTVFNIKCKHHEFMVPNVPEYVFHINEERRCLILQNIEELLEL